MPSARSSTVNWPVSSGGMSAHVPLGVDRQQFAPRRQELVASSRAGGLRGHSVSVERAEHELDIEAQAAMLAAEANRVQLLRVGVDPRAVDAQRACERGRVDEPRGRGQQLVAKQREHALRDRLDVVRLEEHRLALQSAAEVTGLLALEAAFGDAPRHLAVLGLVVAILDEGPFTVALLGLLASQSLDAEREAVLGRAKLFDLGAAVWEPASARVLRSATVSGGQVEFTLGVAELDTRWRLPPDVDGERARRARLQLRDKTSDRVGSVRVGRGVLDARCVGVTRGVEVVGLAAAAERGVAELAIEGRARRGRRRDRR